MASLALWHFQFRLRTTEVYTSIKVTLSLSYKYSCVLKPIHSLRFQTRMDPDCWKMENLCVDMRFGESNDDELENVELENAIQAQDEHHEQLVQHCKRVLEALSQHVATVATQQLPSFSIGNVHFVGKVNTHGATDDFDLKAFIEIDSNCSSIIGYLLNAIGYVLTQNSSSLGLDPLSVIRSPSFSEHTIQFTTDSGAKMELRLVRADLPLSPF